MPKFIDLTSRRFGRLIAISLAPKKKGANCWHCVCDCGNETTVRTKSLTAGLTTSCGCYMKERVSAAAKRNATHGHTRSGIRTRTYRCWRNMLSRCQNSTRPDYARYGGRGIVVCLRWHSFENFLADMGECPSKLELDRIDFDGNYEPSNCRWITHKRQMNNMSRNHFLTANGITQTMTEWTESLGVAKTTIRRRIASGWDIERALTARPGE